jgi:hypothetical protein
MHPAGNLFIYIGIGIIIDEEGYAAEETAMIEHASSDNVSDAAEGCNTNEQIGEAEVQKQEGSVSKRKLNAELMAYGVVWIL